MLGLHLPSISRNTSVMEAFSDVRDKLKIHFSMKIIILVVWEIWMVRNNKIFKNEDPTFQSWKAIYLQELRMVTYRMTRIM
jgi:hypothetical protein